MSKSRWGADMDAIITLVRGITTKVSTNTDYTDVTWSNLNRTIVRTSGSWVDDGYVVGSRFGAATTGGGGANDGDYTAEKVTVLTLTVEESVVNEVSTTTGVFTLEGLDLPAGDVGAERGVRSAEDLGAGEVPHLFVHSPAQVDTLLEFRQSEARVTYQLDIVLEDTQENAAEFDKLIRAHINADRTLGGVVDDMQVTGSQLLETSDSDDRKVLHIEIETLVEDG